MTLAEEYYHVHSLELKHIVSLLIHPIYRHVHWIEVFLFCKCRAFCDITKQSSIISHREKNSLFKIFVNHCQPNHNLWSHQSSTPKVSSVHNKYITYLICSYEFDSSFFKTSSKFSCLLEPSGSEEDSRTKTILIN